METALDHISKLISSDYELASLHNYLSQQGEALRGVATSFFQGEEYIAHSGGGFSPLLVQARMLDVKQSSLVILHLLSAQAEVLQSRDATSFVEVTGRFLRDCCRAQVSVAPKIFANLCHKFSQLCISEGHAMQAILPLRSASDKLAATATCLSPVHADYLHCCIKAKCYTMGAHFMDQRSIFSVDPKKTGLTPPHLLRYFYYGGVVYVGTKRWKDALDSFCTVISTPANTLSALVVEAYKKMVLVSLILHGKLSPLPKYTSNAVSRQLRSYTKEYDALDKHFQAGNMEELREAVCSGADVFTEDQNTGLVKQVVHALTKCKIMQLTHTYITLSLEDIAVSVGLENSRLAENYILRMVESGEISAKIEDPPGTVHFEEDCNEVTPADMLARLEQDLGATVQLTERVRKLETQLAVNPQYIQKITGDHSLQGPGHTAWENDILEEFSKDIDHLG